MSLTDSLGNTILQDGPQYKNSSNCESQRKKVTLLDLPVELLIDIFSYLNPSTLEIVGFVCKDWHRITEDNGMWMKMFKERFSNLEQFSSVARSDKWREELLRRETLYRRWHKGKGMNLTYKLKFHIVTDLQCSFRQNRIITMSKNTGTLLTATLSTGKNQEAFTHVSPSGTTSFDLGKNMIVYGRWDGSVYGGILTKNNLLQLKLEEFVSEDSTGGIKHSGMVTSSVVNKSEYPVNDKIAAFTGDEAGLVVGWNIKKKSDVFNMKISDNSIVKIESNFKDTVVILDSIGDIYVIKNIFKAFANEPEIAKIPGAYDVVHSHGDLVSIKVLVDYGGQNIAIVAHNSLSVYSYEDSQMGNARVLNLEGDKINQSCIESFASNTPENKNIVGGDACNVALILNTGRVVVFNIRNPEYEIRPSLSFYPQLASYPSNVPAELVSNSPCPVTSIAINSLTMVVGSLFGKAELYDVSTGKFLRRVSARLNGRILNGQSAYMLLPITQICLSTDNPHDCRGILCFGDTIQYFQFGDILEDIRKKSQTAKKKINVAGVASDRKSQNHQEIKLEYDEVIRSNYNQLKQLETLDKYNGTSLVDSDEEYEVALALSESLNPSGQSTAQRSPIGGNTANISDGDLQVQLDDDDEELRRALELSQVEINMPSYSGDLPADETGASSTNNHDPDEDEELKRALELSQLEYRRESKRAMSPIVDKDLKNIDSEMSTDQLIESLKDSTSQEDQDLRLALLLSKMDIEANVGSSSKFI